MIKVLVQQLDADCLNYSKKGFLPLHYAIECGDLNVFKTVMNATQLQMASMELTKDKWAHDLSESRTN